MSSDPAQSSTLLPSVLIAACLLLLTAAGTLLAQVLTQRTALTAQAAHAALNDLEIRALRQQLEGERLIAALQSKMLREALDGGGIPATKP